MGLSCDRILPDVITSQLRQKLLNHLTPPRQRLGRSSNEQLLSESREVVVLPPRGDRDGEQVLRAGVGHRVKVGTLKEGMDFSSCFFLVDFCVKPITTLLGFLRQV